MLKRLSLSLYDIAISHSVLPGFIGKSQVIIFCAKEIIGIATRKTKSAFFISIEFNFYHLPELYFCLDAHSFLLIKLELNKSTFLSLQEGLQICNSSQS
jgi:hypothetical protein